MNRPDLKGRTPYELVTGDTPDITEWIQYTFNQTVWYYDPGDYPEQRRLLGKWIGVSHRIGQAMCYWILPESGTPISRTMIQALTQDESKDQGVQLQVTNLEEQINV